MLTHARALLAGDPGVVAVGGELRDIDAVLTDPAVRGFIDLDWPVGVLLAAVLHFVVSDADAARIDQVTALLDGCDLFPPGVVAALPGLAGFGAGFR